MLRQPFHHVLMRQQIPITAARQLHVTTIRSDTEQNIFPDVALKPHKSYDTDEILSPPITKVAADQPLQHRPEGRRPHQRRRHESKDDKRFGRQRSSRSSRHDDEKLQEKEFVPESTPYTPATVSLDTLASSIPAMPITPLGQSSCLQRELMFSTRNSNSWDLKAWKRHENKRELYAKKVIAGKYPPTVREGDKTVGDAVRRKCLLNGTYGRTGTRLMIGAVKERLPNLQLPKPEEMKKLEL